MPKKKPCRICRRWFLPDCHEGERQQVCGRPECQRERHRRNCADYHRREGAEERRHRIRQRILRPENRPRGALQDDPLAALIPERVRDAVGVEVGVVIEEFGKVIVAWSRDSVRRQLQEITGKSGGHPPEQRRDDIAAVSPGP